MCSREHSTQAHKAARRALYRVHGEAPPVETRLWRPTGGAA